MANNISTAFRSEAEVLDAGVPLVRVRREQDWVDMSPYCRWLRREAICERTHVQDYELKLVFNSLHGSPPQDNTIYIRIFKSDGPIEVSCNMGTDAPGWGPVSQVPLVLPQSYITSWQSRTMRPFNHNNFYLIIHKSGLLLAGYRMKPGD